MQRSIEDWIGNLVYFVVALPFLPVAVLYLTLGWLVKQAWTLAHRLAVKRTAKRNRVTFPDLHSYSSGGTVPAVPDKSAPNDRIAHGVLKGPFTKDEETYVLALGTLRQRYDTYIDNLEPSMKEYWQFLHLLEIILTPDGPPLDLSDIEASLPPEKANNLRRTARLASVLRSSKSPEDDAITMWASIAKMALEQKRPTDPRDDFQFLEWLQRYVGFWSDGRIEYGIRRREDGWLQGYRMTKPAAFVAAAWIMQHAHKTGDPPGPLGMRPILVTESLARYWLSPTPNGSYPGSIHVSRGREIIVEAVEQKMREADPESIQRFWRSQWKAWSRKPLDADDVALGALLLSEYETQGDGRRT